MSTRVADTDLDRVLTCRIFLKAVAVIYGIAIVSFWSQFQGLIGDNGILPVAPFLDAVEQQLGAKHFWYLPTLSWLNRSEAFVHLLCGLGVVCVVLVVLRRAEKISLFLLWAIYLSLVTDGQRFMSYQWDNLLLEVGFLAIWLAPMCVWRARRPEPPPSRLVIFALHALLFKLMFSSGVVKLASGDEAWRTLTALTVHYETQPIPTWTAWWMHQLPVWFQQVSCAFMFFIELVVPFFFFGPRRFRLVAAACTAFLQLLIAATGNYTFFNGLALALCIPLLDDRCWPLAWRGEEAATPARRNWNTWAFAPFAVIILLLSAVQIVGAVRLDVRWPMPVRQIYSWVSPLRTVSGYGLFAVMTNNRSEIIVEGSADGRDWRAYGFRWKPGDRRKRPGFVAPHQPRLDWQMWFAALGPFQGRVWFANFLVRLLQGSPEVLALLEYNPFPNEPPRYVRAQQYDYRFTTRAERKEDGAWWRVRYHRPYSPVLARPVGLPELAK